MSTIARVEAFPLRYPEPNDSDRDRYVTPARVETDDGAVGWGESSRSSRSRLEVSDRPGLGVEVDEAVVRRYAAA